MNVPSLLNDVPESRQRWWTEEYSDRNRTPWDAGGYSLPMHTYSNGLFPTLTPLNESPLENHSNGFGHKFSDSHSSLSSFASSNNASHSRFSSTSTLSSLYPHNPIAADTESRPSKVSSSCSSPVSPSSGRSRHYQNLSLADCVNKLALVAEHSAHSYCLDRDTDQPALNTEIAMAALNQNSANSKADELSGEAPRPISPSDAVFMGRSKSPLAPRVSQFPDLTVTESLESCESPLSLEPACQVSVQQAGGLSIDTKYHKRALSAPDFQRFTRDSSRNESKPSISPSLVADITPPSSRQQSTASPRDCIFVNDPSTPPHTLPLLQERKPCCMYITDCDTGSQLRKAVSHIFGRNKMCTRRIPTHVWVWYCRKHYQRARYRNAKEWARTLQYDLVTKQIDRLQQWSDENRRLGEGDVVRDYELAIRKREQRRIDAQKSKRDQDFSDSEEDISGDVQDDAPSTTAVPDWLRDRSGRNYNAAAIHKIIDGIKEDLASGKLSAWPDIEILPNIVKEEDREGLPSGVVAQKSSSTHYRSQSLSITQKAGAASSYRSISRTRIATPTGHNLSGGLSNKRKRFQYGDEDDDRLVSLEERRARGSGRAIGIETSGHRQGWFEQPSNTWDDQKLSLSAPRSLIFAPQRYDTSSRISQVTPDVPAPAAVSPKSRNITHQQSHSDLDDLFNQQPLSHTLRGHTARLSSIDFDNPTAHRHSLSPRPHLPSARTEVSGQGPPFHLRHQSTPLISNSFRNFQSQGTTPRPYQPLPLMRLPPGHTPLHSA